MQDIVFYVAASETIGTVRNYANTRNQTAPALVLGVSACLRMRMFTIREGAAPYPIASFDSIADWQWSMDDCIERNASCKLKADLGGISVHTVTDTVNGETMSFTEFVIPISDMNTQELAAWLGNRTMRSGLTGELVGYDSEGNAAFVLQVENFTVRNRIAGLCDPTVLDQEIVTRTQAEYLIRSAVSSSADLKQDKLDSSNAGTGISISSGGTISTANIPQSAVTGLSAALASKQEAIAAGDLVEISGATVNRKRYMAIREDAGIPTRTITIPNSTATVAAYVLEPGNAYKIHVASTGKWLATAADFKSSTGTWGIEGHIALFVAGTGFVRTDSNVVLSNALEPDAVNNCTVRFHDGLAIINVEDHVAGYIVVSASGSTAGTLPCALGSASQEYIAFDASLNSVPLDMDGVATNGEKHVVGNGYTETVLSGGVSCTSKTTFANLSMDGVSVLGGTMTLGDVYLPQGATVSVSGGLLAIEKVTGAGSLDLGETNVNVASGGTAYVSGCTVANGSAASSGSINVNGTMQMVDAVVTGCTGNTGGAFVVTGRLEMSRCTVSGNDTTNYGGAMRVKGGGMVSLTGCVFSDNYKGAANSGTIRLEGGCMFRDKINLYGTANVVLAGSNTVNAIASATSLVSAASVTISSGAVVDLTGTTYTNPIVPGGGITLFGGCFENETTILYGSGSSTGSHTFVDLEILGTTINKYGIILGATVFSDAGDDHEIIYTEDDGATLSAVIVMGETVYAVPGGLVRISNT